MIVKMLFLPGGLMPKVGIGLSIHCLDPNLVRRRLVCYEQVTFFKSPCHVVDYLDQGLECTHLAFDGIFRVLSLNLAYDARGSRHLGQISRLERLAENDG